MKKYFDGIQKQTSKTGVKIALNKRKPVMVSMDGIKKQPRDFGHNLDQIDLNNRVVIQAALPQQPVKKVHAPIVRGYTEVQQKNYRRYILGAAVVAMCVAFLGGINFATLTPRSGAEASQSQVVSSSTPPGEISLGATTLPADGNSAANNNVLFNTPIGMLQSYFSASTTTDSLANRKAKLTAYLQSRGSPLVDDVDTIAEQDHWKLILAISFAESTLGKKCYEFNCSGIGGANIKTYKSFKNWILDFNRLLEKRYKDWTLKKMCGVYVQPCTNNWLNATQQILDELDQQGIE